MDLIKERMHKSLLFLKKNYNWIILFVILFAFIIRIYYFSQVGEQPIWWDEGDYMSLAKKWGSGILSETPVKDIWSPRRPFLMPIIWSLMFIVGFGEMGARFLQLIFSVGCVYLIYLLGKEMYNKNVGLISAFLMSVFYLQLFYTYRLSLEIASLFFVTLTLLFFWKGYIKKNRKYVLFTGIALGLAIFTRSANLLIILPMFFMVLFKKKLIFLKEKRFWISILLMFLVLSPFIIYLGINYSNPLQKFTGVGEGRFSKLTLDVLLHGNTKEFIKFFPTYLKFPMFYIFLVGLVMCLDFFLGLDLLFKKRGKKLRKHLFLILWILTILLFFGITTSQSYLEPRYLMNIFPAVFIITSLALLKGYNMLVKINKNYKTIAISLILILLLIGGYNHIIFSDSLIDSKKTSYLQVKEAGLWIKENSKPSDVVFSNSVPQNNYYSERATYLPSQHEIDKELNRLKPKYLVVSVYERTNPWFDNYPSKKRFPAVKIYFLDREKEQPVLIIYEAKY